MADIAAITALIEPEATALGLDLVRVKMFGGQSDPTLQVMAERPDTRQLNIDDCADLSRRISDRLDALEEAGKDPIDVAYRLEVSSPGIDRPLTRLKDFATFEGYDAKLETGQPIDGRKRFTGVLAGVEGADVLINIEVGGETQTIGLNFDWLSDAKLMLTDELIAEMLRQKKEAGIEIENLDESIFDEVQTEDGDDTDVATKE